MPGSARGMSINALCHMTRMRLIIMCVGGTYIVSTMLCVQSTRAHSQISVNNGCITLITTDKSSPITNPLLVSVSSHLPKVELCPRYSQRGPFAICACPLWLPAVVVLAARLWLCRIRTAPFSCPVCDYDMRGLVAHAEQEDLTCPECGAKRHA